MIFSRTSIVTVWVPVNDAVGMSGSMVIWYRRGTALLGSRCSFDTVLLEASLRPSMVAAGASAFPDRGSRLFNAPLTDAIPFR